MKFPNSGNENFGNDFSHVHSRCASIRNKIVAIHIFPDH